MASAHVMQQDENLSPASTKAAANLQRSAERVKLMIDDLFVFTRTRLGDALPMEASPQDLHRICHNAADEVRASNPDASIEVRTTGELSGTWDGARINQLVVNLLTNAVHYGSGTVLVAATGDDQRVRLAVANEGSPIPKSAFPTLFDPLTRGPHAKEAKASRGMGLGLYICRCIAHAHSGKIAVESNERETVFTVELPRSLAPSA